MNISINDSYASEHQNFDRPGFVTVEELGLIPSFSALEEPQLQGLPSFDYSFSCFSPSFDGKLPGIEEIQHDLNTTPFPWESSFPLLASIDDSLTKDVEVVDPSPKEILDSKDGIGEEAVKVEDG